MEALFIFLMASYGVTNIITGGSIFAPLRAYLSGHKWLVIRKLGELISCPLCLSFWVGTVWHWVLFDADTDSDLEWVAFGAMASGFVWIVYVIMQRLGEDKL